MSSPAPRRRGWYDRWGSLFWIVGMVLVIWSVWRMDVPSGNATVVEGRVEAAEDGKLTVATPQGSVTVESKVPYRKGDAVKLKRYTTAIFKRTVYEVNP